jgi:hypothetical protein
MDYAAEEAVDCSEADEAKGDLRHEYRPGERVHGGKRMVNKQHFAGTADAPRNLRTVKKLIVRVVQETFERDCLRQSDMHTEIPSVQAVEQIRATEPNTVIVPLALRHS